MTLQPLNQLGFTAKSESELTYKLNKYQKVYDCITQKAIICILSKISSFFKNLVVLIFKRKVLGSTLKDLMTELL